MQYTISLRTEIGGLLDSTQVTLPDDGSDHGADLASVAVRLIQDCGSLSPGDRISVD